MSKINAFIEAGKKVREGDWEVGSRLLDNVLWDAVFDTAGSLIAYIDGEEQAELIAAARNAVAEVEEMVEWIRDKAMHSNGCAKWRTYNDSIMDMNMFDEDEECTCGMDRIREIVK